MNLTLLYYLFDGKRYSNKRFGMYMYQNKHVILYD